jgi:hypothetical protein
MESSVMPGEEATSQRHTTATSTPSHLASRGARHGLFAEVRARLFGERVERLTEEPHHAPFMSYVLTTIQSVAVVLVLGHAEIPLLFSGNIGVAALMAGALALLVATVVVADYAAIQTMRRIPVLARNRSTVALWEHGAYLAFVLAVELITFALVLSVIDRDPQALLSRTPIVPVDGPIYWAQIVLRAALVAWTAVQLYVAAMPLPLQWATLDHKSMALLGGHAKAALQRLELTQSDVASVFSAFAAVSRRPPRRRTWWNGWRVRRDHEAAGAEAAHQQEVIRALEGLSRDHAAHWAAERADLERARQAAEQAERDAHEAVLHAKAEATQAARAQLSEAFVYLLATGTAPEWLAELAPEVATLLPHVIGKGRRMPRPIGPQSIAHLTSIGGGSLDDLRAILAGMGVHEAPKPDGMRRGIWVRSSDIEAISDGAIQGEEATNLARRLGHGAKNGRAYIAPLDALIGELAERNKLHSRFIAWHDARRKHLGTAPDTSDEQASYRAAIPA